MSLLNSSCIQANLPPAELEGKPEDVMLKKTNIFTVGMQKSSVKLCQKFRLEKMSPCICTRKNKSCNDIKENKLSLEERWEGREGI